MKRDRRAPTTSIGALGIGKRIPVALAVLLLALPTCGADAQCVVKGNAVFERIIAKAQHDGWSRLSMPEAMQRVAMELQGTPYVAGTLELSPDKETPSVDFEGLDCVTFFETTLDMARMLRKGEHSSEALGRQIEFTRYRGGKATDYASRLHYTTDWFFDNEAKHVVRIIPGLKPFPKKVDFMTAHAELYPALKAHPELVAKMRKIEAAINVRNKKLKYVPAESLADFEAKLQTGDIVGIVTDTLGLDISHTGIVVVDESGVRHFMDASSKTGVNKVVLEPGRLSESIGSRKHSIGAIFARPLEP